MRQQMLAAALLCVAAMPAMPVHVGPRTRIEPSERSREDRDREARAKLTSKPRKPTESDLLALQRAAEKRARKAEKMRRTFVNATVH